jgi:hypothetical protein
METFMVRVWTPDGDDWAPGVRGTATHLASGRQVAFTEAAGLIAFIAEAGSSREQRAVGETQPPATSTGHVRQ